MFSTRHHFGVHASYDKYDVIDNRTANVSNLEVKMSASRLLYGRK
jgi:hypothetical protein